MTQTQAKIQVKVQNTEWKQSDGQTRPMAVPALLTRSVRKKVNGSRVVSVLNSGAEGHGLKSQSRRCRVTVLGKLLTPIVPLFTKQQHW